MAELHYLKARQVELVYQNRYTDGEDAALFIFEWIEQKPGTTKTGDIPNWKI